MSKTLFAPETFKTKNRVFFKLSSQIFSLLQKVVTINFYSFIFAGFCLSVCYIKNGHSFRQNRKGNIRVIYNGEFQQDHR
jgi:hypothetical protein